MIKNTTNSLVNLANVTRRFEVTEVHKDGEKNPIPTFKFDTANGQPLTVTGQLAYNVCNFLNFDFMGRKAGVAKAKMFERAEGLDIDWTAYGAKDAKDFYVKMLAIDKSQFEKYALASKRFMNDDLTPKIPCLEGATIGKLVKLNQYYPALRKNFNDESQLDDVVLQTIARDFEEGTINLFMTDDKFDEAIKKSFATVEEPKQEEPKQEIKEENGKPSDMVTPNNVMFTALNKMSVAMEMYHKIESMEIKTERERKLEEVIKAFVSATEYTIEIFK